jgi:hypothetical protein
MTAGKSMSCLIFCLAAFLIATPLRAQYTLPSMTVGGVTYNHVHVTMVTSTDIYFTSDRGMANARLSDLEPALQSYFDYDPKTAGAADKARQSAAASYSAQIQAPPPAAGATNVAAMAPHWFGPDAIKPDFLNTDVTKTQEFPYAVFDFVSSDLNRAVAYRASNTESNWMTRFFYTDLSVPKKKLNDDEMQEINHLYRLIATNEMQLEKLAGL